MNQEDRILAFIVAYKVYFDLGYPILKTKNLWQLGLPVPVKNKFGLKMHGRACKQYIFRFCNTSTFNAMRFDF